MENSAKTSFEYNVCGNKNRECSDQGKGERSAYKEKGLKVIVKNLVLELRGTCGCTEVTVLAYPARRTSNGDLELVNKVVFNFNTLAGTYVCTSKWNIIYTKTKFPNCIKC